MKKYSYIFIIFLFFLFPSNVYALVKPTNDFYINDYAEVLSKETEEYILKRGLTLNDADGTQFVVVTVSSLEGMSLEVYANKLFNSFGIGDSSKNNGILILFALEEREIRVEVGDGLGSILPDGKVGRFLDDYMIPYFKENDWDNGIKNGYDAFYSEIVEKNNLTIDYTKPIDSYSESDENDVVPFGLSIMTSVMGMIVGFIVKSTKNKKANIIITIIFWLIALYLSVSYAMMFVGPLFIFLLFFVICVFFETSGGGRSRYYGSRSRLSSSYSRSSSRGFSGGGGRSSGGGASRKF